MSYPEDGIVRGPLPLLPTLRPGEFFIANEAPPELKDSPLYCEDTGDQFDIHGFRARRIVHDVKSPFQDILIADTVSFGRVLFLDGLVQSSAEDQTLYHELLVQPAMLAHPLPRDVLIIGGGEGATLRQVLENPCVRRVVMVDIDEMAVDACRTHLWEWHRGAFDDSRVRLVYEDGRAFVERDDGFYDVVIIDVVDMFGNGPAQRIYTAEFHTLLKKRLRAGGIVVVQGMELSHLDYKSHTTLARTLKLNHSEVASYRCSIPSFLSSWGFVVASDWFRLREWPEAAIDKRIYQRFGGNRLEHLDGEFLTGCHRFCSVLRRALALPGPTLADDLTYRPPPDFDTVGTKSLVYPSAKDGI